MDVKKITDDNIYEILDVEDVYIDYSIEDDELQKLGNFTNEQMSLMHILKADSQPDACKVIKQKNINEKIPEEQACLYLLGRICIYSESGYMPDYVVDQLCDISEYSCNHMG